MNWARKQRLAFIEKHLKKYGKINRSDIMEAFGLSTPQASLDLKEFMKLNPKSIKYDAKQKYYKLAGL